MANIIIKDSWRAILKHMPAAIRYELYDAICAYQEGETIELSDDAAAVFETFRKDMELSRILSEYGKKGASIKWNNTEANRGANRGANGGANSHSQKPKPIAMANNKAIEPTSPIYSTSIEDSKKDNSVVICEYPTSIRTIEEEKRECRERKEEKSTENMPVAKSENAVVGSADFIKFQEWIKAHAPRVAHMQRPFKQSEFDELRSKFTADEVSKVLVEMDNYRPLIQKNMSAYRTAFKWLQRNREVAAPQKGQQAEQSNFEKVASVVAEVNRRHNERAAQGIKRITLYGDD